MNTTRTASDWLLLLALVAIWGTTFVVTEFALEAFPAATVAAGRLTIAAGALLLIARGAGLRLPRGFDIWRRFAVLALVGNAAPFFLISWGQERIDSALAGVLMAVMPLATLLLAHRYVESEPMTVRSLVGYGLGFAGVVVLVGPDAVLELGGTPREIVRQLAVLAGALCYAANTVLARRLPEMSPLVSAAAVMLLASLMTLPVAWLFDGAPQLFGPHGAETPAVVALVWLGLVSTAVAMIVYFRLVMQAGATFLSLINYLIPLVAAAVGFVVLGERLPLRALAALAVILAGIAISQSTRRAE